MNKSKFMLGILGEDSDVKGHNGTGVSGVVGVWRSSVNGGLDLDDFPDEVKNSLVRLFFFFSCFEGGGRPSVSVAWSSDVILPCPFV